MTESITTTRIPFQEQNTFFQNKTNRPTGHWTDVYGAEHDREFAVAGAMREDLLADLRTAVDNIIAQGGTLADFRRDFQAIVARYGWEYHGGFGWRTRVIYETNVRSSYMAGRFQQLWSMRETRPYWEYRHSHAVETPREAHLKWHGMILRWDDPWWITNFPPNGWGCQCGVVARRASDLARLGKTGPDVAPDLQWQTQLIGQRRPDGPIAVSVPEGVDPGFEHTPGRSLLAPFIPAPRTSESIWQALDAQRDIPVMLPIPRKVLPQQVLPAKTLSTDATTQFLQQFGAVAEPVVFKDAMGAPVTIGASMFDVAATGSTVWAQEKLTPYALLLAQTLQSPDEIWTRIISASGVSKAQSQRYYVARYQLPDSVEPLWVVVEWSRSGWSVLMVLSESERDERLLNSIRQGYLAYARPENEG